MLKQACMLCKIVGIIVIIGALNWGLVGVANFNLVDYLFGVGSVLSHIIYTVVGLSGLALLSSFFITCPGCCGRCDLVDKDLDKEP
jgi:uncharacterized membrane protein YuzA (DUF378 family)